MRNDFDHHEPPTIVEHEEGTLEATYAWTNLGLESAAWRQLRIRVGADSLVVEARFRRAGHPPTPWQVLHHHGPEFFRGRIPLPIPHPVRHLALLLIWAAEEHERQSLLS